MNTRIGKKLLSLMLVGCLCASLLSGTVLAANAEETAEPDSYIGDISADDADAVDEPAENAETATVEEDYTAPVSYADVESGTCGENVTWTLEDGVLTTSGEGEMEDYAYGGAPWYSQLESVTTVVIGNGVTSIGEYAFYGCTALKTATLGSGVATIGERAFYNCSSLTAISIPDSTTSIGSYAFAYCTSLTSITIPNSVTSIGSSTFEGCTGLTSVTIPDSVTSIGSYAFKDCTGLTSVTIPDSVTSIGRNAFDNTAYYNDDENWENDVLYIDHWMIEAKNDISGNCAIKSGTIGISPYAFDGCTSLTSVTIPDSMTSIGYSAFYGCTSLTSVTIPDSVTSIGNYAFYGCTGLTSVIISPFVTYISQYAFSECSSLTSVTIPYVTTIAQHAFSGCSSLESVTMLDSITSIYDCAFYGCSDLTDVYYCGSEAAWNTIKIGGDNECLTFATIHYNSTGAAVDADTDEPGQIALAAAAQVVSDAKISYNASNNNYTVWSAQPFSAMYENDSGALVRVEYVDPGEWFDVWEGDEWITEYEEYEINGVNIVVVKTADPFVLVEEWSAGGTLLSSQSVTCELSVFGGFYSGENYNFLVFGQDNSQDDSCEVLRVVKYSKDWERLSACSVYGVNTSGPFAFGSLRMTETDGRLYLHTCHEMYNGHQANMTFVISQEDMTVQQSSYNVSNIAASGYVSHSVNQFIQTDGTYVYRVDHGDGAPRAVTITKCSASGSITNVNYTYVLEIQGDYGANATGVSAGGFELSSENCLIVGNSVDQSDSSTYTASGQRNIFLAVTDKSLNDTTFVWLTDYADSDNITPYTPQLVKLNNSQFLILWEEYDKTTCTISTKLVAVNADGEILDQTESDLRLSDCQPIFTTENTVCWYVTDGETVQLYTVNPYQTENTPEEPAATTPGDLNGDGEVNASDLTILARHVGKVETMEDETALANADVTGDGNVDASDLTKLAQYVGKIISSLD